MCPEAEGKKAEESKLETPEADKIEKLGAAIAAYFSTALDLLIHPKEHARQKRLTLNGKVIVFSILSLVGSTVLFGLAVGPLPKVAPLLTICVVTLLSWATFGAFSHVFCRLLGGKAPLKTAMALVMEILSVATLLASFSGYLFSLLERSEFRTHAVAAMGLTELTLLLYLFLQSLGALYKFGWFRSFVSGVFLGFVYWFLNAELVVLSLHHILLVPFG